MRIYVGNLSWASTEEELRQLFDEYGSVTDVSVITDRDTGRSRGFGFVEMEGDGGKEAIAALDGTEFGGRRLTVNEARPRHEGR